MINDKNLSIGQAKQHRPIMKMLAAFFGAANALGEVIRGAYCRDLEKRGEVFSAKANPAVYRAACIANNPHGRRVANPADAIRGVVQLEISVVKMRQLLEHRQIYAVDFRCLDRESTECVKKLFLQACARNLHPILSSRDTQAPLHGPCASVALSVDSTGDCI